MTAKRVCPLVPGGSGPQAAVSIAKPPRALFSWVTSGRDEKAEKRSLYPSPHSR